MNEASTVIGYRRFLTAPYVVVAVFALITIFVTSLPRTTWLSGLTHSYLSVHIVLEFIGILVSFGIFTVGWATYRHVQDWDILILCIASFAVGWLDLGHTLAFTGMPDFFGPSGPNRAIDFWFASRATGAAAFLYLALSHSRAIRTKFTVGLLLLAACAWVTLAFVVILGTDGLPIFFVPGKGLTPVKITIEWVFVGTSALTGFLLFRRQGKGDSFNYAWLGCAAMLYAMCSYFFTRYGDFDDLYNFSGHCLKAFSFLFLYRAVFSECVSRPYERAKALAESALQASSAKSRFLANVSHEFRTPLGVIGGFSDMMLTSGQLDETSKSWAKTIERNANQLGKLIDDLLDLAKAETDKIDVIFAEFDVVTLIRDITRSLDLQAQSKGVSLEFSNLLVGPSLISSDEGRLGQILFNVMGNAVKFTSNGRVEVSLSRAPEGLLEITVADSGVGINAKDSYDLFKPFAQVGDSERRRFGGTGLGLSLSRRLAGLLGGNLILKSSQPGVGSVFSLTFADQSGARAASFSDRASVAAGSEKIAKMAAPDFSGRKILVAEDSTDNQMLIKTFLAKTRAEITFACNGREATALIKSGLFDLILMDIQMPIMDGFEATEAIRAAGWKGLIFALTAHVHQPERDRAMQIGFDDYLVKPINKESLWRALDKGFARVKTAPSPPAV